MLNKKLLLAVGVAVLGIALTAGYNRPYRWWPVNDMTEQQSIKAYHENSLRTPPEGSMSLDDEDPVPDKMTIRTTGPKNPIPVTEESLAMGKELYDVFCITCHGPDFGLSPDKKAVVQTGVRPDTGAEFTAMPSYGVQVVSALQAPDEHIYSVITNGNAIMKRLDYHLSPEERWHVVNYVRTFLDQYEAQQQQQQ